jgi:effector-binding domain-containing protein
MNLEIKVEEYQNARPALAVRSTVAVENLPQACASAYQSIMEYLIGLGEQPAGMPFAGYYNMDMQNLDVEIGFPVAKHTEGKGNIKASEIAAGKYVTATYKGPYKDMVPAYDAIQKWIDENGFTTDYSETRPCYEFYLNSPMEVPESELLTEIVIPVK